MKGEVLPSKLSSDDDSTTSTGFSTVDWRVARHAINPPSPISGQNSCYNFQLKILFYPFSFE